MSTRSGRPTATAITFPILSGVCRGTSHALEAFEPIFNQNLNDTGDLTTTVIRTDTGSFGSTSLTVVGNAVSSVFYLDGSGGSGPALKYGGADVTVGSRAPGCRLARCRRQAVTTLLGK